MKQLRIAWEWFLDHLGPLILVAAVLRLIWVWVLFPPPPPPPPPPAPGPKRSTFNWLHPS